MKDLAEKIRRVIESCQNADQLVVGRRYLNQAYSRSRITSEEYYRAIAEQIPAQCKRLRTSIPATVQCEICHKHDVPIPIIVNGYVTCGTERCMLKAMDKKVKDIPW